MYNNVWWWHSWKLQSTILGLYWKKQIVYCTGWFDFDGSKKTRLTLGWGFFGTSACVTPEKLINHFVGLSKYIEFSLLTRSECSTLFMRRIANKFHLNCFIFSVDTKQTIRTQRQNVPLKNVEYLIYRCQLLTLGSAHRIFNTPTHTLPTKPSIESQMVCVMLPCFILSI